MLDAIKAELESLDRAMEVCGELAVRLDRLAKALEGEQKEEAANLGEVADKLADGLLGISINLEHSMLLMDKTSQEGKQNDGTP
jgi:hypothetical protein